MALTIQEVEHVALLARLKLDDDEKELFAAQLSSILDYANRLNELSTEDVEPLVHILPIYNVFREDEVQPGTPREEILSNAPLLEDNQYKVPKII
ncbi:MAG: Asp-tRNA(Asn)/Glu-tRNA(Gln) amidotransferase subunit GatC [Syntrophomonadaceae bacterium]|nr:Asp-tRNA(Asn)/Glu-tRNA(Gln) amidotransferase subunit GatC [Syntrophomonadaceae bacterium]MDD3889729.1 Asp-tRNA(Asn)/Glu-tRNA(Gln) amidotransferase subunit GatC [Syntrophomonadaceae bacterium]MDD4550071.1 Asp-tRNA(Asn)/Glu-tRNA(Gln) amidotransferase subunit GatC [Syntrophomonadaceae bacterium]